MIDTALLNAPDGLSVEVWTTGGHKFVGELKAKSTTIVQIETASQAIINVYSDHIVAYALFEQEQENG